MEQIRINKCELTQADSNKLHHLKFLMAIFVVVIHTVNLSYYGSTQRDLLYYVEMFLSVNLCRVAVPMFFFISGLLFFRNIENIENVLSNIKKRVRSIVIPYFWWNIFGTVVSLVIFQLPVIRTVINSTDKLSLSNVLKGIFLYEYFGRNWYLVHLMAFFLLTPVFSLLLKSKKTAVITLCALLVLNFTGLEYKEARFFHVFYFYCGAFLVKWYPKVLFGVRYKKITCILALIPVLGINLITMFVTNWFLDKLALIVMMIGLWIFVDLFAATAVWKFEKQSFFIYCMHGFVLETIEKLIGMIGKTRFLGWIDYIIAPILCLLAVYVLYRILMRFAPGFYGFINGGRIEKKLQKSKG